MRVVTKWFFAIALSILFVVGVEAYRGRAETATPAAQDTMMLNQRLGTLEQRIYTIESRINGLEQLAISARRSSPAPTTRDPEVDRLRSEMELLKNRVRELECGLVRLDERTLATGMKNARRRTGGQPLDPCRQNTEVPIQLSTRR
jgi:hypothetical protein